MRKMKNEEEDNTDKERKKGNRKIECRKGMIRRQQQIERNGQYQRGEQPKWQRIKVTNTPPVTLQLLSLMGGLGD